ncbi:MAG: UDP-N-acetylmuramoyl-tripeptide--D-alanyl-D-alanine ligase [Candidatus Krumholzibacteria bacterium]|nr:UDP-N-acetylmuramoyl-tripeptide--D-alanyl-D-alanine ligase [Candidatus Krumholzibacteria bacterium]
MAKTLTWVERSLKDADLLRRGDLFGRDDDGWLGATIDSRGDCSQRIFFALKGEHTDGNRFAGEARSKGCRAVIIDRKDTVDEVVHNRIPFFLVEDSLTALQQLARAYRGSVDVRVIAVTGSAGKTTTKEYIKMILKKNYKVHSNRGNLNNHIGVPLTLLEMDHESEYLISEVAANHVGEIDFLAEILSPDIGVITNIGDAHIGLFGSRAKIAEAKAELLHRIEAAGTAVLPGDDDYLEVLMKGTRCKIVTFGYGDECTFGISSIVEQEERIAFEINGQRLAIRTFGLYNVLNAAAAFAVGDLCGIEIEHIAQAFAEVEPIRGRAHMQRVRDVVLIDDSYNANPTSMRVSLDAMCRVAGKRRIAILGDMAELGSYSDSEHRQLGSYIVGSCVDRVYWLGEEGQHVAEGMGSGEKSILLFDGLEELCGFVEGDLQSGDVVLVKASRASALDKLVARLQQTVLKEDGK